jgi:phage-related protein
MRRKPVRWIGRSLEAVRDFPQKARRQAGAELRAIQDGEQPTDFRPMPDIGPGAMEIRIRRPHEHRVIYVARYEEAIYVLHAFEKKTRRTPQRDIKIARANYAEVQRQRESK